MNCYSVKLTARVINMFSVLKTGVIVAISTLGIYFLAIGKVNMT